MAKTVYTAMTLFTQLNLSEFQLRNELKKPVVIN
jgi:hypothetical protein